MAAPLPIPSAEPARVRPSAPGLDLADRVRWIPPSPTWRPSGHSPHRRRARALGHNPRMRIDCLPSSGPTFSFEFFPPKSAAGAENLSRALADLQGLGPVFVSVTYGAGGSTAARRSRSSIASSASSGSRRWRT